MARRYLGRIYPTDIQDSIWNLSKAVDDLMSGSLEYAMKTDLDVSGQVRDLNSRLVNDVIIVSDKITDDDARERLQTLRGPIGDLQVAYAQAGVTVGYPEIATTESMAVIPRSQAESLVEEFKNAQRLYLEMVNRYVEIRPAAETAVAMPVSGNRMASLTQDVERRFDELGLYANDVDDAVRYMERLLKEAGDAVQLDRRTFDQIRRWISLSNETNQVLERLEGIASRKPAENGGVSARISWWIVALLGGAALTGIIVYATSRK